MNCLNAPENHSDCTMDKVGWEQDDDLEGQSGMGYLGSLLQLIQPLMTLLTLSSNHH